MMKTGKCPVVTALVPLRKWIAHEMLHVVEDREYDYGAKLKAGDAMLDGFMNNDPTGFLREKRRKEAADRCGILKECLKEKNGEWQNALGQFRNRHETRAAELEKAHQSEIEEFEKQWGDPDYLLAFKKPSPKLLSLRTTENKLAIQKDFERAKRVKVEADRLEKAEGKEAEGRAIAAMKIEYGNMEARHDREMECLQDYGNRLRIAIEQHRNEKMEPLQMLITRLANQAQKPIMKEKKKEGIFLDQGWPESPKPIRHTRNARIVPPGQPLVMSGIKMRQHIKVKKDVQKKKESARKKKKKTTNL
jgi:hypothetical protein